MLLDLENFKRQKKSECKKYYWRMEDALIDELEIIAAENKTRKGIVIRYIIDWACDEVESNKDFRKHMESVTMERNFNVGKRIMSYEIPPHTQKKLLKIKKKYRLYNLSYFVNESIRIFLEKNS
ncbi:hypothetical protein [Clostridium sp.]|uniref:hypothetical protein n=1 Tax=Clostridium sp. TaxID=1506 RepID=UPI0025C5BD78|nr:hypothetical protein [Clostridium sp.]